MKTLELEQALGAVRAAAERMRNDETATVGTVSAGDVVRQGDLYLVCLSGHEPPKDQLQRTTERQLARGSTQGSRHVLRGRCRIFTAPDATDLIHRVHAACPPTGDLLVPGRDEPLIGPVFRTDGPVEVDHPEHGNRVLPKGEWFATVYQRAFAEEVRRQED